MNLNAKKLGYWLLIVVLGVAIGVGIKLFSRSAIAPEDVASVGHFNLIINYGEKNDIYENISFDTSETIFSATQELANREGIGFDYEDYGDMGMLVISIGGKDGENTGAYWQYWVNGKYAQVGASVYEIQDGDWIEWKFTDAQQ